MTTQPEGMTHAELLSLPVSFDLMVAARALGMGRSTAYDLAKRDEFPVRTLRVGNRYRITRADLMRFLGESG